jgi:hypothetical protein
MKSIKVQVEEVELVNWIADISSGAINPYRTPAAERQKQYAIDLQLGLTSVDEIRGKEGLPPLEPGVNLLNDYIRTQPRKRQDHAK